jgi:ABC-type nitrate/sulfonate/bicarbonate transport system permease component
LTVLDQNEFINKVISFLQNNPIIALIVIIVFFFLIYRKTKLILFILILILIFAGIYYAIMDTASFTKIEKKGLIDKSEKASTLDRE